jgi:hypothetical protein
MKIKSKLILAATSLLVLSGVAAGTSTYAWYTANRQVSLGITNISAEAELTTLDMTYDETLNTRNDSSGTDPFTQVGTDDNAFAGTFSKNLTDVSSKGDHNFFKPIFGADDTVDPAGWWDDEDDYLAAPTNAADDVFYHQFVFTFTASGDADVALYLSPKSTVTENASGALNLLTVANAVRMSFSTTYDTAVADTEMIYANPNGEAENFYLADDTDFVEDAIGTTPGFDVLEENGSTGFFDRDTNYTESEFYFGTGGTGSGTQITKFDADTVGFLAQLEPGATTPVTTAYITLDIWIEGTDDDCASELTYADYYGLFDVSLEFYELNMTSMYDSGN